MTVASGWGKRGRVAVELESSSVLGRQTEKEMLKNENTEIITKESQVKSLKGSGSGWLIYNWQPKPICAAQGDPGEGRSVCVFGHVQANVRATERQCFFFFFYFDTDCCEQTCPAVTNQTATRERPDTCTAPAAPQGKLITSLMSLGENSADSPDPSIINFSVKRQTSVTTEISV